MQTTAILVDDERKSLAILENKIARYCPQIEIIHKSQVPSEAIEMIKKLQPDIVFMDIAMPEMSGFDVLQNIPNPKFELIFVTAFNDFAIEAIEHCAIGYLIKPINNLKLEEAVNNATKNIIQKNAIVKNKQLLENLNYVELHKKKIVIPVQDGLEVVELSTIIHIEGSEGYSHIHLQDKKTIISSYRIGYFFKLLEKSNFFLIHRSHLINMDSVVKYINEGYAILHSGDKLPVSRSRRNDFLDALRQ